MEIATGVHRVTLSGEVGGPASTHVYYVTGSERGAFIDTGPTEDDAHRLIDYWRDTLGSPATGWAFHSHRHHEHVGGARLVKETTGARIAAGRADADAIDEEAGGGTQLVDDRLDGGERFELGDGRRLVAVATPGHTGGTVCYFLEPDGVLFTGDHIMGRGTVVIRTDEGGSIADYIASLRSLHSLHARQILSGHGEPINDVPAKLDELVAHREQREVQILELLNEGVGDVDAMLVRLYGADVTERTRFLAHHQVIAHLEKLVAEGRASAAEEGVSYRSV